MNGLSSDNLQKLIEIMRKELEYAKGDPDASAEIAIEDIMLALVDMMASPADSQSTRPDRIGDECWYAQWDLDIKIWIWRRGIFRGTASNNCPFVIEDTLTKNLELSSRVTFSIETSGKPAHKPQD
jgi:hypothetical protein